MSLLPIIERVDNFDAATLKLKGIYTLLSHDGAAPLGYITPTVAKALTPFTTVFNVDDNTHSVRIHPDLNTLGKRTDAIDSVASTLRSQDLFETLQGWRDEQYVVYYPSHEPYVLVERAFCPLLGVVMYGVHINGYIPPSESHPEWRFWVPRRSETKPTFPGMLDNTIAGGLGYPYGVHETVIKESHEEAGIEKEYVERNLRAGGMASYIYLNEDEGSLIQPEIQYIFDMEFDERTEPFPVDNEAEYFRLMTLDEVMRRLLAGEFKPNCALVMVDFLIRHGLVTAETEPAYVQIILRCHRAIPFVTR